MKRWHWGGYHGVAMTFPTSTFLQRSPRIIMARCPKRNPPRCVRGEIEPSESGKWMEMKFDPFEQWKKGHWCHCLFRVFFGDEILPSYVGIILTYSIIRIRIPINQPVQWKVGGFFRSSFVSQKRLDERWGCLCCRFSTTCALKHAVDWSMFISYTWVVKLEGSENFWSFGEISASLHGPLTMWTPALSCADWSVTKHNAAHFAERFPHLKPKDLAWGERLFDREARDAYAVSQMPSQKMAVATLGARPCIRCGTITTSFCEGCPHPAPYAMCTFCDQMKLVCHRCIQDGKFWSTSGISQDPNVIEIYVVYWWVFTSIHGQSTYPHVRYPHDK